MQRYNAGDVDGVMELMDPEAQCKARHVSLADCLLDRLYPTVSCIGCQIWTGEGPQTVSQTSALAHCAAPMKAGSDAAKAVERQICIFRTTAALEGHS